MRTLALHRSAALLLLAGGCGDATAPAPRELHDRLGAWAPGPGATVLQASQSGLADPTLTVVGFPAEWRDLWTRAWAGSPSVPPLPEFDFVLSSVVVVGVGKRAGGGHSVVIDSIVTRTTGATLYATSFQAGVNCAGSTGTSSPVHMVLSPGHPPVVAWRISEVWRNCPSPAIGR